jgi:hypothetical protein
MKSRFHGSLAGNNAGKGISNLNENQRLTPIHHLQPNQKIKAAGPFY